MQFEFHLDRSSRKYRCPQCGRRSYVLYLDRDDRPLDETVGRCDRRDKCGRHYTPSQYREQHGLRRPGALHRLRHEPARVQRRMSVVDTELMIRSMDPGALPRNPLYRYLVGALAPLVTAAQVRDIMLYYGAGSSRQFGGSALFWQIDALRRVRTGKIMGYDAATGRRVKDPRPQMKWVHSGIGGFNLRQCWFGTHVAAQKRELPIWLMESEKAALITALAFEWGGAWLGVPVATGGCGGFNPSRERLRDVQDSHNILRGREVVLFPDNGMYAEWGRRAAALRGFCSDIWLSTVMEEDLRDCHIDFRVRARQGEGLDDLILRHKDDGALLADLLVWSYGHRLTDPPCVPARCGG